MNFQITYNQFLMLEQEEKALTPMEIVIFKELNRKKTTLRTKKNLEEFLKRFISIFDLDELWAFYFLQKYALNYRKDGRYDLITKADYVDPKNVKGKLTPNVLAGRYSKFRIPFRGSNLEGYWRNDRKGREMYVVDSYGWYPIFIFRDDKWYVVSKRYSPSTGRQMSNVRPVKRTEEENLAVYTLTPEEMKLLKDGMSHEELMNHKIERLGSEKENLISKRTQSHSHWSDTGKSKAKYKIKDVEIKDGKGIVYVDVYELKGPRGEDIDLSVDSEQRRQLERRLTQDLSWKKTEFLGKEFDWYQPYGDYLLNFVYNYVKK